MNEKLNKLYSHILIIGNGFDLNLGIKTGYTDFIQSEYFNSLIDSGNHLAKYLSEKHKLENWIDVENELKNYSNEQDNKEIIEKYETNFENLSAALMKYLNNLDYSYINQNAQSYAVLETVRKHNFLILDFNYTGITKKILAEIGFEKNEIEERVITVHNSLEEKQIIFGVEDDARIKPEHVFLRKAFSPKFKAININEQLEKLEQLIIFGHSLGETDHMYFKKFFQSFSMEYNYGKGKSIDLFYHGKESYKRLLMQIDKLTMNRLTIFKQNNKFKTIDTLR